jgi:hypothetical protein
MTQDEEIGESKQDMSTEEEPEVATKVIKLLTIGKGKWKAVPARAKDGAVEGLVSTLLKLLSTCVNTNSYSATDA